MKPDLQTRIVEVLRTHGAQPARDIPRWLKDVDSIALDCGLAALRRANKITLFGSTYSLSCEAKAVIHPESTPQPELPNPLKPATLVCMDCRQPKVECEFQLLANGARSKICSVCHGRRSSAGARTARLKRASEVLISTDYTTRSEVMKPPASAAEGAEVGHLNTLQRDGSGAEPQGRQAQATQPSAAPIVFHSAHRDDDVSVNGSSGVEGHAPQAASPEYQTPDSGYRVPSAASIQQQESPRERGDNCDVSTERCQDAAAVPETSGSYSRSDPREDARTPASTDIASPRIAERVFERVKAQRQDKLNRIALLEVELTNARSYVAERDRFLADYLRFGGAAT